MVLQAWSLSSEAITQIHQPFLHSVKTHLEGSGKFEDRQKSEACDEGRWDGEKKDTYNQPESDL